MPSKNGDAALAEALEDQKVKDAPQESLKEVLRLVMLKVGLRANNLPSEDEKLVLISHIVTHYGNHTIKEIRLAFEMAITGRLDIDPKDVVCYENFSCLYFSNIINAYRKWARKEIKYTVKETPMIEEEKNLSDKTYEEWMADQRQRLKTGMQLEFLPYMLYDWALQKNLITLEKEKDYQVEAAVWIGKRLAKGLDKDSIREYRLFKEMFQKGEFEGEYAKKIQNLSKQMMLNDYLLKTDNS